MNARPPASPNGSGPGRPRIAALNASHSARSRSSDRFRAGAPGAGSPDGPCRKIAATTPNSATKAGNSSDCANAAANGSLRNTGSSTTEPSSVSLVPAPGISAVMRDVMNAAMPALPSTLPICRVVL